MSTLTSVCDKASKSAQLHSTRRVSALKRAKLQLSRSVSGVGPAESTGKSETACWPDGTRPTRLSGRRRPRKPREIRGSLMAATHLGRLLHGPHGRDSFGPLITRRGGRLPLANMVLLPTTSALPYFIVVMNGSSGTFCECQDFSCQRYRAVMTCSLKSSRRSRLGVTGLSSRALSVWLQALRRVAFCRTRLVSDHLETDQLEGSVFVSHSR